VNLLAEISKRDTLVKAWKGLTKRPFSYGLDEITIESFRYGLDGHLEEIQKQLHYGSYKFYALRLYLSAKKDGGYRPIKIPSVRDRVVQKAIADTIFLHLDKKYDLANKASYAYLPGKKIQDASSEILKWRAEGYKYVCKADIKKFFENINKDALLKLVFDALPDNSLNTIIEAAVRNDIESGDYMYYERMTGKSFVYDQIAGIAQGSPLSPMFANLYLWSFDKYMNDKGFIMIRYADDMLFLCKTMPDAEAQYRLADSFLRKIGLELYPLRSDIPGELWKKDGKYSYVRTLENLEFLGLRFSSGKVYPANSAYKKVMKEIRGVAYSTSVSLVKKMNSINSRIQGWSSAFSYTTEEGLRLDALDTKLEDVLTRTLKIHGLKKVDNRATIKIFGFPSFKESSSYARLSPEEKVKRKSSKRIRQNKDKKTLEK
jgi:RNA-directed DNA polymerase